MPVISVIAYAQIDVFAFLFCVIILAQQKPEHAEIFGNNLFRSLILALEFILILDLTCWLMSANMIPHTREMHLAAEGIYFVWQVILSYGFMMYCFMAQDISLKPWQQGLLFLPIPFTVIAVAVNLYHPFAFHILADGSYARLGGHFIILIGPLLHIVGTAILCTVCYLRSSAAKKAITLHLFIFSMIGLISSMISAFVFGFSLWGAISLNLVYLYLNVQSKREKELGVAALRDSLTGLKNATAYRYAVNEADQKIRSGNAEFCVTVLDINYLKETNDHYGHKAGDQLIIRAGKLICDVFAHSPVFRVGGDEFVVISEGDDFAKREELFQLFELEMNHTKIFVDGEELPVSLALGSQDYQAGRGMRYNDVFKLADQFMYDRKHIMKKSVSPEALPFPVSMERS